MGGRGEARRVMFEIAGVSEEVAREALRLASHKLPIKTKIVTKKKRPLRARMVVKHDEGKRGTQTVFR